MEGQEYLCGDYSIADIANWVWAAGYEWSGLDITGLDNLKAWVERVGRRPAVHRGRQRPPFVMSKEAVEDGKSMIMR